MSENDNVFCDQIPIVTEGKVQKFSVLIVLDNQHNIQFLSDNDYLLQPAAPSLSVGKSFIQSFLPEVQASIKRWLQSPINRYHDYLFSQDDKVYWGHKKIVNDQMSLEIEPISTTPTIQNHGEFIERYNRLIKRSKKSNLIGKYITNLAKLVYSEMNFDVVRVYKLDVDASGTVIAENKKEYVPSFLNFRFPSTDIPRNFRQNFLENLIRYVPDIKEKEYAVLPSTFESHLFLKYAQNRALHPIHRQYIANMKAQSIFTVAIIINQRLWGLLACQSQKAYTIHPKDRFSLLLLVEHASNHIHLKKIIDKNKQRSSLLAMHQKIEKEMRNFKDFSEMFTNQLLDLNEKIDTIGYVARIEEQFFSVGRTPNCAEVDILYRLMSEKCRDGVFYCNDAPKSLKKARASSKIKNMPYGVLMIKISPVTDDFLMFFRDEYIEEIIWAGNPNHQTPENNEMEYSPRASFGEWKQKVKNKSKPWSRETILFIKVLRQIISDKWLQIKLHQKAQIDPLTTVYNRNFLEEAFDKDNNINNDWLPCSVALIDIDDFKCVNDEYGHIFGDKVLKKVALLIQDNLRHSDIICRYGGEEFLVILKKCNLKNCSAIMAQILKDIRSYRFKSDEDDEVQVTVSIGITEQNKGVKKTLNELIDAADKGLYKAKEQGKDQIIEYEV